MKKLIGLLAVALMLVAAGCEEYKKDIILINNTDEPLYCLHIDSNDAIRLLRWNMLFAGVLRN